MKKIKKGIIQITDKGKAFKKGRFYITFFAINGRKVCNTETYNTKRAVMRARRIICGIANNHDTKFRKIARHPIAIV